MKSIDLTYSIWFESIGTDPSYARWNKLIHKRFAVPTLYYTLYEDLENYQ